MGKKYTIISGFILILILSVLFSIELNSKPTRESNDINKGWSFTKLPFDNINDVWLSDPMFSKAWDTVDLPHCVNALDAVDASSYYYRGRIWYKKNIDIRNPYKDGRVILCFEGAGQKSDIWIYKSYIGNHTGGYDEFYFDITDQVAQYCKDHSIKESDKIVIPIAISVDNIPDVDLVPSDLSDFNLYGGIYRKLRIVCLPKISLDEILITPRLSGKYDVGIISVSAKQYNPENVSAKFEIKSTISDLKGRNIYESGRSLLAENGMIINEEIVIKDPALWSPGNPALYTLELEVSSAYGKYIIEQKFGFRNIEFKNNSFFLNGKKIFLKGVHRHEDYAGYGAAVPDKITEKEFKLIKEMGSNFIRLAHYQQSKRVLDLCDSLGLLVWEEIPWCRGGLGGTRFRDRVIEQLNHMIIQHYNHPSVAIWGLGNEIDWVRKNQMVEKDSLICFVRELNTIAHVLDPSRLTGLRKCDICSEIPDVYSPSIWPGWYYGRYTDYYNEVDEAKKRHPNFFHAEWGADAHPGRHSEAPDKYLEYSLIPKNSRPDEIEKYSAHTSGDWSESYACNLIDWYLHEQLRMDFSGSAYWIFKDFSSPNRGTNPIPYVNQKGLVQRDLTTKESYYVFQSYWAEKSMLHIYGKDRQFRWGKPDELKEVKIYSNCDSAVLFVNAKKMDTKLRNTADFPASGLRWDVFLQAGINKIRVAGYAKGSILHDSCTWTYIDRRWNTPANIQLQQYELNGDTVLVRSQINDNAGTPCLDCEDYITFDLAGSSKLIDKQGTSVGSNKIQCANGQAGIKILKGSGKSALVVRYKNLSEIMEIR